MSGIVGNNTNRSSGLVKSVAVGADAINGSNIADDAIDSEHYVDVSIDAAHIASNAVTTAKINADAVTGAKIADDALDSEHYTDGSIDTAHLAADVVTGAKIADDAIDSEHYADGSIDTAHIADNQITLAKMAGGTDGQIITYDASGDPVAVGPGTDGQVLTSTGAGSPPAFEDAGGGGSWNLLSTTTTSGTPTVINILSNLDSTYDVYKFVFFHARWDTASSNLNLQFRISGSFITANVYSWYLNRSTSAAEAHSSRLADTGGEESIRIMQTLEQGTSPSNSYHQGEVTIYGNNSASSTTAVTFHTIMTDPENVNSGISFVQAVGSGFMSSTGVVDGVRFYAADDAACDNGAIFKLYGIT